jgi:hypothetical protein
MMLDRQLSSAGLFVEDAEEDYRSEAVGGVMSWILNCEYVVKKEVGTAAAVALQENSEEVERREGVLM